MKYRVTESTNKFFVLYNLVFSTPGKLITAEGLCDDLKRLGKSLSKRDIKSIQEYASGTTRESYKYHITDERSAIESLLRKWYSEGRLYAQPGGYSCPPIGRF